MRVLITGGTGFCGRHLARHCLAAGDEVTVLGREASRCPDGAAFRAASLADGPSLAAALRATRPEAVFHLAALSSVARSYEGEPELYRTNVLGTLNLLQAMRAEAADARLLVTGSAEEYAREPARLGPLDEDSPPGPVSPYGVSKASATLMSLREARAGLLDVIVTRTFNLTGPGQAPAFVCADFADRVARAVAAGRDRLEMTTGNLEARRDFSAVTEAVAAYRALIERGERGRLYNVCSGVARPIREIVERLGMLSGLTIETRVDPARLRPGELPEIRGDGSRLKAATGLTVGGFEDALAALYQERLALARM